MHLRLIKRGGRSEATVDFPVTVTRPEWQNTAGQIVSLWAWISVFLQSGALELSLIFYREKNDNLHMYLYLRKLKQGHFYCFATWLILKNHLSDMKVVICDGRWQNVKKFEHENGWGLHRFHWIAAVAAIQWNLSKPSPIFKLKFLHILSLW